MANPKSIILTIGDLFLKDKRILSGLISLWAIPIECKY
jgi:hypothetical protein